MPQEASITELPECNQTVLPVSREETQQKLDRRSVAVSHIKPKDKYTIADRLEEQAENYSDRPFLIYGEQSLTYADVNRESDRLAHHLYLRGLKCGDVCAMALENRPEFYVAWFALVKIGAVVAFINTQISGRILKHAITASTAKLVLVGEECLENFCNTDSLPDDLSYLVIPDAEKPWATDLDSRFDHTLKQQLESVSDTPFPVEERSALTAESPTLLIFTSGTTGLPKAARYSHMRWMSSGDVMVETISATPEDVFYCCLPLYHGAAATAVTSTALAAGSAIAMRRKFSVRAFWEDICRYKVTVWQYIGEICRYILNKKPEADDKNHSLRIMMGAGLSTDVWQKWINRFGQIEIYEGWGSTEANTALINVDNYLGSCGRVPFWDKTNLRLVRYDVETEEHLRDENGFMIQCEPGEVGEAIGYIVDHPDIGAGRFEGYTSEQDTEKKILRDVFTPGDAYWSSGDLLRYDEDGYFYFVDRIGDTYRWKSENVSTQEVADALLDYQDAELINVYGVKVPEHEGRAGMAAIVMKSGVTFDADAFYRLTNEKIPRYAAPQFIRISNAADMTTTFKLRKVDLQKQGYNPAAFEDPLFVRDEANGTYAPYSKEVLHAAGFREFC